MSRPGPSTPKRTPKKKDAKKKDAKATSSSTTADLAARARQKARLSRIEGQVRGLARMLDDDRPCLDVVAQLRSVEAALRGVEVELVRAHLHRSARRALGAGSVDDARLDELAELLARR